MDEYKESQCDAIYAMETSFVKHSTTVVLKDSRTSKVYQAQVMHTDVN
jgi:hypothetical protein